MSVDSRKSFLLLYGSQKGQAKSIADIICSTAKDEHDLEARLFSMEEHGENYILEKEPCVVIVTSTTGDGDPPDNAVKLWKALNQKELPSNFLENVYYTLLGLGDTNYNNFCNCGKSFHQRMKELGAKCFYEPAWADDGTGLEEKVDPWMDGLWPALLSHLKSSAGNQIPKLEKMVPKKENTPSECEVQPKNIVSNQNEETAPTNSTVNASLSHSIAPLSTATLTVPAAPKVSLIVNFDNTKAILENLLQVQNGCAFPSAATPVFSARVHSAKRLTHSHKVKKIFEMCLMYEEELYDFLPGDSIGIICENDPEEVQQLLVRLNLVDVAAKHCILSGKIPQHLPPKDTTLLHIFTTCSDIRAVPKKALVRLLAEYTSDSREKRRLLELCSRQGASDYATFVRNPCLSLIDILLEFSSCMPPVESLLEHLPRLLPRPYSLASTPLSNPRKLRIVFSVLEIPKGDGRKFARQGVCTKWLAEQANVKILNDGELEGKLKSLSIGSTSSVTIPFFFRKSTTFRIPVSLSCPVVMIGPGTGISPFIGFLEHFNFIHQENNSKETMQQMWLFYGCRHKTEDCLFKEECDMYQNIKTLSRIFLSFSRDDPSAKIRYVQDNIDAHAKEFVELIEKGALIYVCGDARNMANDVFEAVVKAIASVKEIPVPEARTIAAKMRVEKKYLQDVWA